MSFEICMSVELTNCHLEIFSRPQLIENSRQYSLLRTDVLQKTVVGCPQEPQKKLGHFIFLAFEKRESRSLNIAVQYS